MTKKRKVVDRLGVERTTERGCEAIGQGDKKKTKKARNSLTHRIIKKQGGGGSVR